VSVVLRTIRLITLATMIALLCGGGTHGVASLTGGCTNSGPLPLDAQGSALGAYGTCALGSSWLNGKMVDVTASGTHTISFINGYPDVLTIAGYMGISPVSGIGGLPISKIYDQSGNANDCTQATSANQLSLWLINGKVYIAADGWIASSLTPGALDKYCTLPSGLATNNQAMSAYFVTRGVASVPATESGLNGATLLTTGTNGSSGWTSSNNPYDNPSVWQTTDWQSYANAATALVPETQNAVVGTIAGTGGVAFTQNEESASVAAITAGSAAGGFLYATEIFSLNMGFYGRTQAAIIWGSALSSGAQTTVRNSLYALFGINKSPPYNLLIDGASVDYGTGGYIGGILGYGWEQQLIDTQPFAANVRITNTSLFGATIEDLTATWATRQKYSYSASYSKNVLYAAGWAAFNSIAAGDTGAVACTAMGSYITAAKAAGTWTEILVVVIPNPGASAEVTNYQNCVVSSASGWGATLIDMRSNVLQNSAVYLTNPVYVNQSGPSVNHPTVLGYQSYLAQYIPVFTAAF
jgi:hypothetical protein